jgi:hypothetical protein
MKKYKSTDLIELNGVVKSICDWEKGRGFRIARIIKRLNTLNWSIEEAINTPTRTWKSEKKRKYPMVIGKCKYCLGEIVAKRGSDNMPWRKFCSYRCKIVWRNKNIPQTDHQRQVSREMARKLGKRVHPLEERMKASLQRLGSKCHFWKGGVTPEHRRIRTGIRYKVWRESVFKRDNWTCVICGIRGGILNAHHIKGFSMYPELRFELDNGQTMCHKCHKQTENYGKRKLKTNVKI